VNIQTKTIYAFGFILVQKKIDYWV